MTRNLLKAILSSQTTFDVACREGRMISAQKLASPEISGLDGFIQP